MYEWMSITKAALGTLFYITGKDYSPQTKDILMGTTQKSDDDDKGPFQFDYKHFREVVERDNGEESLQEYAEKTFASIPVDATKENTFVYNNIGWQVIAAELNNCQSEFAELLGTRRGWTWETVDGICLGPHGIKSTLAVAYRFGQNALPHLRAMSKLPKTPVPPNTWGMSATHYSYGWWWVNQELVYAHGYQAQFIVVNLKTGQVDVQLRDKFWTAPTELEAQFVQQHVCATCKTGNVAYRCKYCFIKTYCNSKCALRNPCNCLM